MSVVMGGLDAERGGVAGVVEWVRARRGTVPYRLAVYALVFAAFVAFVGQMWQASLAIYVQGGSIGSVYGLLGVGIILIYRTNRIVNFAAASLGAVPAISFALLMALNGLSWWIAFPASLVCAALLGFLVDVLIIRRFDHAPRLILTVATIGVSQILAYIGLLLPGWMGNTALLVSYQSPFTTTKFQVLGTMIAGDYVFGVGSIVVTTLGLAAFLRYTRVGIALRASAENADRAALLGIPVKRVEAAAWTLAALLAGVALFARSGMVGVPVDGSLGPRVLLFGLTAAVVARMESMILCLVTGAALGVMATASASHYGSDNLVAGVMVVVVLAALLLQRSRIARAFDAGVSSWQSVREFRPVPDQLKGLQVVRIARGALGLAIVVALVVAPLVVGKGRVGYATLVLISSIVAVSLVVLSGWAGQISLGQFGIVGVGAAVAGQLAGRHNLDFFFVLLVGIAAGAVVSALLGIPALRIPGLYLSVATLAFAGAMELVILDRHYWIGRLVRPPNTVHLEPPVLWGRVALGDSNGVASTNAFYYVALVALAVTVLVARAYRRSNAGRAIVAIRENTRAASSYSINPARTKLAAFAVSGGMAAMAGVLLAYQTGAVDPSPYGISRSIAIFTITAIGGLASVGGAVLGTILLESIRLYGEDYVKNLSLLVTGPGLLLILLFQPGGLAEFMYRVRDRWLRRLAVKRGIDAPSLVADRRVETTTEQEAITRAEEQVESVDAFDVLSERRVTCPVCDAVLSLADAPDHEHLRVGAKS